MLQGAGESTGECWGSGRRQRRTGAWAWQCPVEEPFPADPSLELTAVTESALENSLEGVMAAEGPTEMLLLQQREIPEEALLKKKMFTIFFYKKTPFTSAFWC